MQGNIKFFNGFNSITGTGDLKSALSNLLQLAAEAAKSSAASIYLVNTGQNTLEPLITYGLPQSYVEACGHVRIGEQCCGRAVQHRKPWVVTDMLTDPLFASARAAAVMSPIRAAFSVPVIAEDGQCIGSLACHFDQPYTPTAGDIQRNKDWAIMIAHVISEYKRSPSVPNQGEARARGIA